MTSLHVCALSDAGKVRHQNQDAFLVNGMVDRCALELRLLEGGLSFCHSGLLCAVADGMGGHRGGAEASQVILSALALELPQLAGLADGKDAARHLANVIRSLHRHLRTRGTREPELAGLGATLVGVYLRPEYGLCFHVGDSRLYRYRAGSLMQMTSDHSPEVLMRSQAGDHTSERRSGVVVNSVGGSLDECTPETADLSFREGDLLLLCSDGLSDALALSVVEGVLRRREDPSVVANALVTAANAAGGRDNITVVLIKRGG